MHNLLLILIILVVIGLTTKSYNKESFENSLDLKYYHNNPDCVFNGNCELYPNDINFYAYPKPKKTNIRRLKCSKCKYSKITNCTNDLNSGCFKNKSCPCMKNIEEFVNVTNSPGINTGGQFPNCPQGFTPTKDGRCVQFCRGCVTGLCHNGVCSSVI